MQKEEKKCSLCLSPGTNSSTCPLNPDARSPNPAKHHHSIQSEAPSISISIKEQCSNLSSWWPGTSMVDLAPDDCDITCRLHTLATRAGMERIGRGNLGITYGACHDGECIYVLKVQADNINFRQEVRALYELNGWEYSPRLYDAWTCQGVGFIVTERLETLHKLIKIPYLELYDQLITMVKLLHKKGWAHMDINQDNIMCKNGHLAFIDFGLALKLDGDKIYYKTGDIYQQEPLRLNDVLRYDLNGMKSDPFNLMILSMHSSDQGYMGE